MTLLRSPVIMLAIDILKCYAFKNFNITKLIFNFINNNGLLNKNFLFYFFVFDFKFLDKKPQNILPVFILDLTNLEIAMF